MTEPATARLRTLLSSSPPPLGRSRGAGSVNPLRCRRPAAVRWLCLILVLPGGVLILLGLALAWLGLIPLLPWLRRLQTATTAEGLLTGQSAYAPTGEALRPAVNGSARPIRPHVQGRDQPQSRDVVWHARGGNA